VCVRAIRFDGKAVQVAGDQPEPVAGPGEAVVRPSLLGVGEADLLVVRGAVNFTGVLGHEFVGTIASLNAGSTPAREGLAVGAKVVGSTVIPCRACDLCKRGLAMHCRARTVPGLLGRGGVMADLFSMPLASLHAVPAGVRDEDAVLALPLASAIHASTIVRLEGKSYITVIGDGPSALIAGQVMARQNASVRVLSERAATSALCEKWGLKHRLISEVGRRQDQDVVVECTRTPEGLDLALRLVRPRGKVVLMGPPVPIVAQASGAGGAGGAGASGLSESLSMAAAYEIEILGASMGNIPAALDALAKKSFDFAGLVTRRYRLSDAVKALASAASGEQIKVVLDAA
jgi:alcohol dehydrogenase